jgi:hypothetical protein
LVLQACGVEPPKLISVEWRLEQRPATEGAWESLSVFANLGSGDPERDIESIAVVNDASGLSWKLQDGSWTLRKEGGDTWLGGAGLAGDGYAPLPRGEYRVVATDLGGQRSESTFTVTGAFSKTPLPSVRVNAGKVRVDSAWPETLLLAYDGAGSLVNAKEVGTGEQALAGLFKPAVLERAVSFAAYGYDPKQHFGAYSWRTKR